VDASTPGLSLFGRTPLLPLNSGVAVPVRELSVTLALPPSLMDTSLDTADSGAWAPPGIATVRLPRAGMKPTT